MISETHVRPPMMLLKASSTSGLRTTKDLTERRPRRSRSDSWLRPLLESTTATPTGSFSRSKDITKVENYSQGSEGRPSRKNVAVLPFRQTKDETLLIPGISSNTGEELRPKSSQQALQLHKMGISQQLRCMSQLSDVVEDEVYRSSPDPWIFPRREISDAVGSSSRGRRPRHMSSFGIDSTSLPSPWGRVKSPVQDAASSLYSRPTSAGASAAGCETDSPDAGPTVPAVDLHALFSDWPLKPGFPSPDESVKERNVSGGANEAQCHSNARQLTPADSRKDSGTASFVTATDGVEEVEPQWLCPTQPRQSNIESSNSSIFTKISRSSGLTERPSPPKKAVRKRRSIFKFLRPGSRRNWVKPLSMRSISSPGLITRTPNSYDGQLDDPALLTIQYELEEQPNHNRRASSMNNLLSATAAETSSQMTALHAIQRQPTLADYERNLSMTGDDRRRPSAINIQRAKEVQEDDHRQSIGIRRRISRAPPLKDDASPLMAQALEKHQQEKALFRSASKARESLKSSARTVPVFRSSLLGSLAPTIDDRSEAFSNQPNKSTARSAVQRSRSSTYLLPPGTPAGELQHESSAATSQAASLRSNAIPLETQPLPVAKKRIGTSLESWSRYPSHTRAERCGSAGRPDNVITRDFAVDVNHADIHESDDVEPATSASKEAYKPERYKPSLPKSLSTTFSDIKRYYSNIFSSTTIGQNRRTSITPGGRLEYPELEILPPQMAVEPSVQSINTHSGGLRRLKEHAKDDAKKVEQFIKTEEEKVEDFLKGEEEEFETFVKREEDVIEGFVRKEEGKLKNFIRGEEDKLRHHWHRHPSEHSSHGRESPFREISLFEVPHDHDRPRRDTDPVGPTDPIETDQNPAGSESSTNGGLRFDGASASAGMEKHKSSSKAELWSEVYRECLTRTPSTTKQTTNDSELPTTYGPPPQLRPAKSRSPAHPKEIENTATIRRFPSVTVIDDRKGHFRSISLISVTTSRPGALERKATQEMLKTTHAPEQEG